MKSVLRIWGVVLLFCSLAAGVPSRGESHRATRLGNPATRFAPTIFTEEDLRSRFADYRLRRDMMSVLKDWGWQGDVKDMFAAAATNELADIKIPVGYVMPFMSSREGGRPICLRNVTWAGAEPTPAYSFVFSSRGMRYRCITPKACSNFFVVDMGPEPKHALAIACEIPEQTLVGRKVEACIVVRNLGNVAEPLISVALPTPQDAVAVSASGGGELSNNTIAWQVADLAAGESKRLCATFRTQIPGVLAFEPVAKSEHAQPVQSSCATKVLGVSALLLEKADDPDPVSVGSLTSYTVKVTNQGTADDTGIKVVVQFPAEIDPVSASNGGEVSGKTVTFPAVARLTPKEAFEYTISARGVKEGDARVTFIRTSDDIPAPTMAEESTRIY